VDDGSGSTSGGDSSSSENSEHSEQYDGPRLTVQGCECHERWNFEGINIENYCGNPDNDSGGEWCHVVHPNCTGQTWGYCAPAGSSSNGQWDLEPPYGQGDETGVWSPDGESGTSTAGGAVCPNICSANRHLNRSKHYSNSDGHHGNCGEAADWHANNPDAHLSTCDGVIANYDWQCCDYDTSTESDPWDPYTADPCAAGVIEFQGLFIQHPAIASDRLVQVHCPEGMSGQGVHIYCGMQGASITGINCQGSFVNETMSDPCASVCHTSTYDCNGPEDANRPECQTCASCQEEHTDWVPGEASYYSGGSCKYDVVMEACRQARGPWAFMCDPKWKVETACPYCQESNSQLKTLQRVLQTMMMERDIGNKLEHKKAAHAGNVRRSIKKKAATAEKVDRKGQMRSVKQPLKRTYRASTKVVKP